MKFTVSIKNVPSGTVYWTVACFWSNTAYAYPTSSELGISQTHTFINIPTNQVYFWERCFNSQHQQIMYYGTPFTTVKDGGDYTIDFLNGTVQQTVTVPPTEGFSLEMLLPMSPLEGPPLPRVMGIHWPWYEEFTFKIPIEF